ncbi:MAG: hypothetical protein HFE28_00885 [Clostridia bacterium]|jgi:hypothetical protein|nr:hypothetical protein [Clostridia bacterium]
MFNYKVSIPTIKSFNASYAEMKLDTIILERYLCNLLPENRSFSLNEIQYLTGYNFKNLQKYMSSSIFEINKNTIYITDNQQLLSEKTMEYCKYLIKKYIFPSKYTQDQFAFHFRYFSDTKYYTSEENKFISFMLKNFLSIAHMDFLPKKINIKDLLNFNCVNSNGFFHVSKEVYNAILQKKLNAGDSILPYISKIIKNKKQLNIKLKMSCDYDFYFNEDAILKCDLETNSNNFIKNFLNLIIYEINDNLSRIKLLIKLQCRYSILLKDKIFNEFD